MKPRSAPLRLDEVERVLDADVERAVPLPARAFFDEEVFRFEEEAILARSWICVGHEGEIDLPGKWLREVVASEPVIVVRGSDLVLRAFFDVCRHRGASVVACKERGRSATLQCPYHGWSYGLDGRLSAPPFAPAAFDPEAHGLRSLKVRVWRGLVFVTLDDSLPELDSWLGEPPPWLDDEIAQKTLRLGRRTRYDIAANWKLCVENFQESHHFPRVHRALEAITPTERAYSWIPTAESRWLGGTMEIACAAETVSTDGRRRGRPLLVDPERARKVYDAMLFPTLLTSLQPDYFLTYRLTPRRSDLTSVAADIYFHPAAFVPNFHPREVYDLWDRVNSEDRAICEDQQRNARSRAFAPACYATVEEGMHAFDRMVARVHSAATGGELR